MLPPLTPIKKFQDVTEFQCHYTHISSCTSLSQRTIDIRGGTFNFFQNLWYHGSSNSLTLKSEKSGFWRNCYTGCSKIMSMEDTQTFKKDFQLEAQLLSHFLGTNNISCQALMASQLILFTQSKASLTVCLLTLVSYS